MRGTNRQSRRGRKKARPAGKSKAEKPRLQFLTEVVALGNGSFLVRPGRPVTAKMLTVLEAASRLGVSDAHVLNFIEDGRLEAIDVGDGSRKHWRVPVAAFEKFLAARSSLGKDSR
jgi:excisionase family DNA binding protein